VDFKREACQVSETVVLTSLKDQRILPGITRELVLELAAAHAIPYEEKDLPVAALATASEVWLTSSTKEITPVTTVDGRPVGAGVPGSLSQHMLACYGIQGYARPEAPSVYVNQAKIAALGLRIRRGCSYHGFSLNVAMDLEPFQRINPCGYPGLQVTQLWQAWIDRPENSVMNITPLTSTRACAG
jgi:hypothetical protein